MNAHDDFSADLAASPLLVDRLETALWIFDFDAMRIAWANRSALRLWAAADVASLAARDMGAEMSPSVRTRLAQHREDFRLDPAREIREVWTLYPDGRPFRVRATLRAWLAATGRVGMLVEATAHETAEPEAVRSVDALLHTQVMTALYDLTGRALYANPAHRSAFGPGAPAFASLFAAPGEGAAWLVRLGAERELRETARVLTVAGERWHDIHAVRCRDAVTGDGAFVVSATDVTEARAQERALAAARDAAQSADRAKSAFLSIMSHELRTPLNGVLGLTSILAREAVEPAQQRTLAAISGCGERMLELVENILDMVSLDAGALRLARGPFDPALLLRATAEAFRVEAERKGLTLATEAEGLAGPRYVHDAALLRKALRQLAANAVKFTERGGVTLRVRGLAGGGLVFEVEDSGPGVSEAARPQLFQRFRQLDGSTTRRHGGVGMGLALCAELAALWNGSIGLRDAAGGGAVFWFTAPDASPAA